METIKKRSERTCKQLVGAKVVRRRLQADQAKGAAKRKRYGDDGADQATRPRRDVEGG